MMRLLITGSGGGIGVSLTREALVRGHDVCAFDKNPPPKDLREEHGARLQTVYGDITDVLSVMRAAEGCDAIIHLAAIPNPGHRDQERLLHVNVVGTGHVFDAAEKHGIERVVLASSAAINGLMFAKNPFDPAYLPIDEDHPNSPQDVYSLSKLCIEAMAQAYTHRTGMTTICLRPLWVVALGQGRFARQSEWLGRTFERRSNDGWAYVALDDCVRAFLLAVEAELSGHHAILLSARDPWGRGDIREAVRRHFPSLEKYLDRIGPHDSLYSTHRAQELLGWEPQHSWHDLPGEHESDANSR